jgi:hypothetical protein
MGIEPTWDGYAPPTDSFEDIPVRLEFSYRPIRTKTQQSRACHPTVSATSSTAPASLPERVVAVGLVLDQLSVGDPVSGHAMLLSTGFG